MALANMRDLLRQADAQKRAVGAFNVSTIEMMCGVVKAAEELQTPVILQVAQIRLATTPLPLLGRAMYEAASRAKVPVALHLDHGTTMDCIQLALDLGFTSVMYDCSMLPFEENVRRIREMAKKAHAAGCSLEAEIGHVGSNGSAEEDIARSVYTRPEDALRFAQESGCDALAVAIGTAHGVYAKAPKLDLDCLGAIAAACSCPLVLHGGSGLSEEQFRACVAGGISKINIFTHNNLVAARAAHAHFTERTGAFELMPFVTDAVKQETMNHIRIFGSEGRA